MTVRPLHGILSLTIDYERDELRVVTCDDRVGIQAGAVPKPEGPLDFQRVTFRPAELTLEMVGPHSIAMYLKRYVSTIEAVGKALAK